MILITASTGHLGQLVIDELLRRTAPSSIVATGRRPEALTPMAELGVVVRELDYDRPETVRAAMDGVTQVLLISGSEIGRRVPQHRAVVDAAVAARVEHIAYTSVLRADTSSLPVAPEHAATEALLDAAPLLTTKLRHTWYIENYTEQLGPALDNGAFVGAAGSGRIAAASRADLAAADVAVLLDASLRGGTYELAGPAFTMTELASTVSAFVRRDLPYVDVPPAEYAALLTGAGVPEPIAQFLAAADASIAQGELDHPSDTLEKLVGRPLTTLGDALAALPRD